jgi:acyl-CoA hydrolase
MASHIDHNEHSVNVVITEQGIADLRGKSPVERAREIIENCAHPDYKQLLWDYLRIAGKGQTPHNLKAALGMHVALLEKGDMRLTNWADYTK